MTGEYTRSTGADNSGVDHEANELTIDQLQVASGGNVPLRGYGPPKVNMSPWINAPHDPYWVLTGLPPQPPG